MHNSFGARITTRNCCFFISCTQVNLFIRGFCFCFSAAFYLPNMLKLRDWNRSLDEWWSERDCWSVCVHIFYKFTFRMGFNATSTGCKYLICYPCNACICRASGVQRDFPDFWRANRQLPSSENESRQWTASKLIHSFMAERDAGNVFAFVILPLLSKHQRCFYNVHRLNLSWMGRRRRSRRFSMIF